jgi:hypothetical protein
MLEGELRVALGCNRGRFREDDAAWVAASLKRCKLVLRQEYDPQLSTTHILQNQNWTLSKEDCKPSVLMKQPRRHHAMSAWLPAGRRSESGQCPGTRWYASSGFLRALS